MPDSPSQLTIPEDSQPPSPAPAKGNGFLERLSLALCGVLAMAFAIVAPPLQVTDEHAHFIRAYLISRGEFVGRPLPELPADIVAFVMRYPEKAELIRRLSPQEIVRDLPVRASDPAGSAAIANDSQHHYLVSGVIATSLYFPLVYLPASAGIWMARTLHM